MMSKHREEAVWQRVMAVSAQAPEIPCPPPRPREEPAAMVLRLLEGAVQDADTYGALAAGAQQDTGRCLQAMAREAAAHARTLESLLVLLTGKRPRLRRRPRSRLRCTGQALQACCDDARNRAAAYDTAAETAGMLDALFRRLAAETRCRADRLFHLAALHRGTAAASP